MQTTLDFPKRINFINLSDNEDPQFQTRGSAGFDFRANIDQPIMLESGEFKVIPTGLYFELPKNVELQVRPRSGLAAKHGVTVLNSPGTVDSDYRGEVGVILINHSQYAYKIKPGERIAQGIFNEICGKTEVEFRKVIKLSDTKRGVGGFGSTGKK